MQVAKAQSSGNLILKLYKLNNNIILPIVSFLYSNYLRIWKVQLFHIFNLISYIMYCIISIRKLSNDRKIAALNLSLSWDKAINLKISCITPKLKKKVTNFRNYKHFPNKTFRNIVLILSELSQVQIINSHEVSKKCLRIYRKTVDKLAPRKRKLAYIRYNIAPFMNKTISKGNMKS